MGIWDYLNEWSGALAWTAVLVVLVREIGKTIRHAIVTHAETERVKSSVFSRSPQPPPTTQDKIAAV